MLYYTLIAFLSYLLGSVSMSIIISKYVYHDDVRKHGSGNAGATNVARTFGWGPGILTFSCDFLKCAVSMGIGKALCGDWGMCFAGIFCLLGHCFPVYFGFRGGKAVSTGACVMCLVDWRIFLVLLAVFFLVFFLTRIVSVSSISAALAAIAATLLLVESLPLRILGIFTALLLIIMHRENIKRLIKHEEKKFTIEKNK